ncbi:MAG: hypothetical protein AAB074_15940 [Planctomycetota bacterium]
MSDSWIFLIPADPQVLPEKHAACRAEELLNQIVKHHDGVETRYFAEMEFFDAGANFETAACPLCRTPIEDDWLAEAVHKAIWPRCQSLQVLLPCCGQSASLNDLEYDFPQGFGKFSLSVMNPDCELSRDEIASLARALRVAVRIIRRHL